MYATEKRTQLYLPVGLYQSARKAAKGKGLSLAGLVRRALEDYLGRMVKARGNWQKDSLHDLVGFVSKGPKNLSETADKFLYK